MQGGNFVGRLNVASEKVDLIRVPTESARPYGIVVARDGHPWVVLFGTNKLATVDPKTLALTEHALARADARPRRLGLTSDGRVWYVDFAKGHLGAFDPTSKAVKEWRMPGGEDSRPYGMAVDSHDRIWAVEVGSQPNRFVAFDPRTEKFSPHHAGAFGWWRDSACGLRRQGRTDLVRHGRRYDRLCAGPLRNVFAGGSGGRDSWRPCW